MFVQLISSDSRTYTNPAGGSYTCGPTSGLDKHYPFPGVYPNNPSVAYDGPNMPLPDIYATGERNFEASMYLLWQPDQLKQTATPSIPVPIGSQQWRFVATTDQKLPIGKGKWLKPTTTAHGDDGGFVPAQAADNSLYGYPLWTMTASTGCMTGGNQ